MSDIGIKIGQRVREFRLIRGYTMAQVADRMVDAGAEPLSAGIIGAWERGERNVSAEHLYYLAQALECTVTSLFGEPVPLDERLLREIEALSDHERQVLRYAAVDWTGDSHALIECVGLYMAGDKSIRAEMAWNVLRCFEEAVKAGFRPDVPYSIDRRFIRKKQEGLW